MKFMFLRHTPGLFLGIVLGALIALGHSVFADREEVSDLEKLPLDSLHTFAEVFTRIKKDYVEDVEDEKLLEYAIEGMLNGLDPHSAYLNPDAYKDLQVGTSGEFGGLGIEVGMENGFVKVIAPIDDTPAQRAGIKAGDLIIRLDKTPVKGLDLREAVNIMRGKPGDPITLTVVREGEARPLKITIVRDIIQVKSIKSRMLEPGYGYIRVTQFQAHTGDDLRKTLNDLKNQSEGELKGLILDLRNNPGGVLNAAVEVADTFIHKGLIVYTEGRIKEAELRFKAKPKDLLDNAPIVVLVNNGSASASEIVAGALQDHKRAIIMGQKTFGKGSVQTIIPMNNQSAVKITTARYFTPSGRSIQAEGIKPDIILNRVELASVEEEEDEEGLSEADLVGHLGNGEAGEGQTGDQVEGEEEEQEPLAKSDYAVYEALNLLKGLSIISSR